MRGGSNVLNLALEARFMAQSTAIMSPGYSQGDALFFCVEVAPERAVTCRTFICGSYKMLVSISTAMISCGLHTSLISLASRKT